jgi:hypothetical protein
MNVEIGAEAALFPEKEYINGMAVAVHPRWWLARACMLNLAVSLTAWLSGYSRLSVLHLMTRPFFFEIL